MNSTNRERRLTCRMIGIADLSREAWKELASSSETWNPFYEEWNVLPAINNLKIPPPSVKVFYSGKLLVGIFFLRKTKVGWSSWTHKYCYCHAPLIRKGWEPRVFSRLTKLTAVPLVLGPVYQDSLLATLNKPLIIQRSSRAFFTNLKGREDFLVGAIGRKRVKELEKKWNKAEASFAIKTCSDLADTFLMLEDTQWKGRLGTSIRSNHADESFFRALVTGGGKENVNFAVVSKEDTVISMQCFFQREQSVYAYRCAYDERFSEVSPGLLLEYALANERLKPEAPDVRVDSCASANSPLFARVWGRASERPTCRVVILPRYWPTRLLKFTHKFLRGVRQKLRKPIPVT